VYTDHLNTPRLVADSTGTTVWRWDQAEPFGNNPADEDPDANTVTFDLPLRLPGQRYDAETGLHYNYFRDYDPSLGRYGESDPIGLKGGSFSTYDYAKGSPVKYFDVDGLKVELCCRPARIARGAVDHCWIKTDSKAAGMNSSPQCRIAGDDYESLYITKVFVSDHSCDIPKSCKPMDNVDEDCVNKELAIGTPLGRFSTWNNCQSFTRDVFAKCAKKRPSPFMGSFWM